MKFRWASRAALLAGLLVPVVVLAACAEDRGPADPATVVVVRIGDRIHTLAEFQRYLDDNLAAEGEVEGAGTEAAAVKSRLFEAFVKERLLLLEADRRELQVSDLEVEVYLGLSRGSPDATGSGEDGDASVTRSDWEEAGRRLKIEKLLEATVRELPPGPATVMPPPENPGSERGRRLRLRSLMLDTPELAARVSREIKRGRVTFDEAVVSHSTTPEQGLPIELAWDGLSEAHRRVLEKLKPGEVSQPVEVAGLTYLFQIEAWLEAERDPRALAEESRRALESARRAEALQALQSKLLRNVELEIFLGSLPFRYIRDDSADPADWITVLGGSG